MEDMCYERRRAEACVDESAHHALVNAGGREWLRVPLKKMSSTPGGSVRPKLQKGSDSRRLDARGGMDPNKWPDKAKEAYNYGVTGFGSGWQRQFFVRGLKVSKP